MLDIDTLKDKLSEETFAALKEHIEALKGQRDEARNESINGRKGLKQKLDAAVARVAELEDYAGVEAGADLSALPPLKGNADAIKQLEAKLTRMQRERDDAFKDRDEIAAKHRSSVQAAIVAKAMNGHEFIDRDLVEPYIASRIAWENDEVFYRGDDGKLISVQDGVAGLAKTKPGWLKSQGAGGAGVRQANAGSGAHKTMPEAEFNSLPPTRQSQLMAEGYTLT